jgi:hypothetical protein
MVNRSGPTDLPVLATAIAKPLFPADYRAVTCLPGPLQFLFAPLVVPPVDSEINPPGGTLRQRIEQALVSGGNVVVFADVAIGTPAGRSRFRLEAIQVKSARRSSISKAQTDIAGRIPHCNCVVLWDTR